MISMISKLIIDTCFSLVLMVLLSPLLLLISVAIKLESRGPVLFRQVRYGYNRTKFVVFKFRTMTTDATGSHGFRQATKNDPRVTRIGRFLRRTSLDELPQLLNVLFQSMSLVGPRPHPVELDDAFAPLINGYDGRFLVKPGITGLAQVFGFRGETDTLQKMENRISKDLEYVNNWSVVFDLKLILLSVFVVLLQKQKNAY